MESKYLHSRNMDKGKNEEIIENPNTPFIEPRNFSVEHHCG